MKNIKLISSRFTILSPGLILLFVFFFRSCDILEPEPQIWDPEVINLQIAEYMEENLEFFSEFYQLTEKTGMVHLLRARGPYTLLLPTNDAMQNYYERTGISSSDDLSLEDMDRLVRNHLFSEELPSKSIGLGALHVKNALGDYIASEFQGSDIILGKEAKIIDRDIANANGIVHVIDKTLVPVTKNVFEVLSDIPDYSIFTEAIVKSGLQNTLEQVTIPYGNSTVRVWFTVLPVPDEVYNDSAIFTVEDLISKYDDGTGDISDPENGFYKYMEYHCLDGIYYLSDINPGVYPVIGRENQIKVDIDTTFKINFNPVDSTFTTLKIENCNVTAKNGVVHPVNDLMPAIEPIPSQIIVHVTHFPDLQNQECYLAYIQNFTDGENQFAKIKWQGDYMQYYFKGSNFKENDALSMSQGYWWLEITIPKVAKGKYNVSGHFKTGNNRANLITYIDDQKLPDIIEARENSLSFKILPIGKVDWKETEEHRFKFKTLVPGIIYLDYLIFDPTY